MYKDQFFYRVFIQPSSFKDMDKRLREAIRTLPDVDCIVVSMPYLNATFYTSEVSLESVRNQLVNQGIKVVTVHKGTVRTQR